MASKIQSKVRRREHFRRVRSGYVPVRRHFMICYRRCGDGIASARTRSLFDFHPQSQQKIFMSPRRFLGLTLPKHQKLNKQKVERYKNKLRAGRSLDPAFLEVDVDTKKVLAHDGRHRSRASLELGIKKIPVIVYEKKSDYVDRTVPVDTGKLKPQEGVI